jgi:predicted transcriptional regulator
MRFSTEQYLVILLAQPLEQSFNPLWIPSRKGLQDALKLLFGIDRTIQHVNRSLARLVHRGIIKQETISLRAGPFGLPISYEWFRVVDFDQAFQNHLSLTRHAKVIVARERRRRKRKEDRA